MTMLGTMLVLRLTVLGTGWATDTVTRDSPEHWKVEPCLAARDSGLESEFQEWRAKPEYEGKIKFNGNDSKHYQQKKQKNKSSKSSKSSKSIKSIKSVRCSKK